MGSGYKRAYVENEDVFELSCEYRQSKANATFSHMIATARRYNETSLQQYYVTCYRWMGGENQENLSNEETFVLPRHGNGDWGISGIRQWHSHWRTYGVSMAYPWRTFVTPLS